MALQVVILLSVIVDIGGFVLCNRVTCRQRQACYSDDLFSPPTSLFFNHKLGSTKTPQEGEWDGSVVSTNQGRIQGCTLEKKGDTEWTVSIDGIEADLGKFSQAIYKKIIMDAKQQRFQGFRPGTIPAHIEPTYRAFCMDECARETVLEAMQQNNIRPFESCRTDMELYDFTIPPEEPKKKKQSRKKKKGAELVEAVEDEEQIVELQWRSFGTMKAAIDAGWKPGQSFSFRAKKVRGQQLPPDKRGRIMNPITGELAAN